MHTSLISEPQPPIQGRDNQGFLMHRQSQNQPHQERPTYQGSNHHPTMEEQHCL